MKRYLLAMNTLIEIRTSIAIFTSTICASLYGVYISGNFKIDLFLAMLFCAVSLDALSTVFNNIYDYYKAIDKEGYLYNVHNPIVAYQIKPIFAVLVGLFLLGIAGVSGLYLVYKTSYILLLIGISSTLIAILYSAGKIPISYYPVSEFISGFFEGTVVFMVASFLQIGNFTILSFLVSLPIAISISNIMLANNTVDIEEDIKNRRKTLPILLGRKNAIKLLVMNTIIIMVLLVIFTLLRMVPPTTLILLLLLPVIIKNLHLFAINQSKAKGFVYALKNSLLINSFLIIAYLLQMIFLSIYL